MALNDLFPADRHQRKGAALEPRLQAWRESRFGMFIHWGLYSALAGVWKGQEVEGIGEWIQQRGRIPAAEYAALAASFNPDRLNVAEWVALAKRAGQKYLVFTAKHHDGFCLFKTAHTSFNSVTGSPMGRDIVGELAEECQKQGIRLGLYYSQVQDWHHPDGAMKPYLGEDQAAYEARESKKNFDAYIETYVKPQLEELLTQYGPIHLIWFDTPMYIKEQQSRELLELVHRLQPDCLVSGRVGNACGDYATLGDNQIPDIPILEMDWETAATINNTWGYKENDQHWKPVKRLLFNLVDIVSKGGNYLLNIGPKGDGSIPTPSIERLEAIGDWLAVNGESIYGAAAGPVQKNDQYRVTQKDDRLFVHVFEWPADGLIRDVNAPDRVEAAYCLDDPIQTPLPIVWEAGQVTIHGPKYPTDSLVRVIVLR